MIRSKIVSLTLSGVSDEIRVSGICFAKSGFKWRVQSLNLFPQAPRVAALVGSFSTAL